MAEFGLRRIIITFTVIAATIIELMELTPATVGMAELVRSASVGWDGTDPIRVLMG